MSQARSRREFLQLSMGAAMGGLVLPHFEAGRALAAAGSPNGRFESPPGQPASTETLLEAGEPVLTASIATGARFEVRGTLVDFRTPAGDHRVLWKRSSRHMIGGTEGKRDYFDLPGVPWVTYFTLSGAAIHGTYWHNDYGRQRSHGCVNVTPDVARFLYRWTMPAVPYEAIVRWSGPGEGTHIFVHA